MAYVVFPGQRLNLNGLSIFVCFVLILCCQVSCVLVNVTREKRDVFAYPGIKQSIQCTKLCPGKGANVYEDLTAKLGICMCKCESDKRTFVIAEFICVADKVLRNATSLEFKLYDYEQPEGPLKVISFDSRATKIDFDVGDEYDETCTLNAIGELSYHYFRQWKSVLDLLSNYKFQKIEKRSKKNDDWMRLTLNWSDQPSRFVGRIMRLNVTCYDDGNKHKTGVMVFKVNGTVRVPNNSFTSPTVIPVPTTYYPTPTPSTESTLLVYSTNSIMISPTMTSSSFQPMTSSSFQPMTSFGSMMSSSLVPMMSSTLLSLTSSFNVFTESTTHSSTVAPMVFSSSSVMVGPAMSSKSPSKAAVTGGIVAGIVVLLLMIVLLVYFLRKRRIRVLRRKHSDLSYINPSVSSLTNLPAMSNPLNDGVGVYENPEVVDGTNRRSGVTSVDSPEYDACLIVENPSARDTKSVYDNIPDPAEPTYKALDPAKREASAKYQSLIKPNDHEYATLVDTVSGAPIQEPLYSEVGNGPSPVPVKNGGPKSPSPPPLTPRKPRSSVVAEPIYNELESSGNQTIGNNPIPSSSPQQDLPNASVAEPIYNELENSGSQTEGGVKPKADANPTPSSQGPDSPIPAEPIYNELEGSGDQITEDERPSELASRLEESTESDGRNGPVYSVLEDEQR